MNEIRIQKIDGVEFVTYKDYLRFEEENKNLKDEVKDLVERNIELNKKYMLVLTENKELKHEIEQFKKGVNAGTNIIERLEEKNQKLKYIIDLAMEKAGIEYIRLSDGDVFVNPKNKLHIQETIQVDILNNNK